MIPLQSGIQTWSGGVTWSGVAIAFNACPPCLRSFPTGPEQQAELPWIIDAVAVYEQRFRVRAQIYQMMPVSIVPL